MKKLVTLFAVFVFLCGEGKAQYVNIPDSSFRNLLIERYPSCFNVSQQLDTSCNEIVNEDTLNISGSATITNLTGLNYFKNLTYLNCSELYQVTIMPTWPSRLRHLEYATFAISIIPVPTLPDSLEYLNCSGHALRNSLPLLPNSLKYLNCSSHQNLISLPALPPLLDTLICMQSGLASLSGLPHRIKYIDVEYSNIATIDYLPDSLQYFNCSQNELTTMPNLPAGLKKLYCYGNRIGPTIPALPPNLEVLHCSWNSLISLPDMPHSLDSLACSTNKITQLPFLPETMRYLDCSINPLHEINNTPDSLLFLNCSTDSLATLPQLPHNLEILYCHGNEIAALPELPLHLKQLNCSKNNLTSLPSLPNSLEWVVCHFNEIYCLPKLPFKQPNERFSIRIDFDRINCLPNFQPNYFVSMESSCCVGFPTLPLCNPINNINHCQSFPIISGDIFYDNNYNGVKDANEPYKSNAKVELSNGAIAYTNNNGYFEIAADSLGTYTITPIAPNYFSIIPTSATYNFTTYDTIVSKDYALQANTIKDSFAIKLTPLNWAARPGFSFPYFISYENAGTTTLSPNIVFNYDDTRLTYDSSSNSGVINNGNNLSLSAGSFVPGQQGNFTAYFKVKTTAAIGDSLFAKATISDNAVTAADSSKIFIRGSYDPNDKQATPELSPLQVFNGTYIDYTIRFQNTGTDTAFNIVISDTLNEDLLTNTLQMIASSHNCKTTVKDNIVFFEFINILLPDSNINETKSHGFVSFRIKPQTTVGAGTTIPNRAAIYFDYNAPVITNTAGTFIKPFVVVPVKLVSFSAVPQTDNTTILFWNTANEINTKYFVIEQSSDGIKFNSLKIVLANGRANNNYSANVVDVNNSLVYYRLKITDNDGSVSYSPILKIDRRKNTSGIAVMINPVKDFIIINTNDRSLNNTQASIINMQGAVVKSFTIKEGSQTIAIKDLPAGIYYLKTVNGSSRVLKQ